MNNKKYELTTETKELYGKTLHRIRALKVFGNVKAGELGGWIEKEDNLSHSGNCWICGEAVVYGNAEVCDNAKIYDNAWVYGNAKVYGNAWVCDNARVYDNTKVYDNAKVYRDAKLYGNAWVLGNAEVYGNAEVFGNAKLYGNAIVFGNAWVYDNAEVYGNTRVYRNAEIYGNVEIYDNAWVYDNAEVYGNAEVFGNARMYRSAKLCGDNKLTGRLISKVEEYIEIQNPKGRIVTCVLKNGNILYNVGCQEEMTKEEFIDRIYNTNGGLKLNPHREYYLKIIKASEIILGVNK